MGTAWLKGCSGLYCEVMVEWGERRSSVAVIADVGNVGFKVGFRVGLERAVAAEWSVVSG